MRELVLSPRNERSASCHREPVSCRGRRRVKPPEKQHREVNRAPAWSWRHPQRHPQPEPARGREHLTGAHLDIPPRPLWAAPVLARGAHHSRNSAPRKHKPHVPSNLALQERTGPSSAVLWAGECPRKNGIPIIHPWRPIDTHWIYCSSQWKHPQQLPAWFLLLCSFFLLSLDILRKKDPLHHTENCSVGSHLKTTHQQRFCTSYGYKQKLSSFINTTRQDIWPFHVSSNHLHVLPLWLVDPEFLKNKTKINK